MVKQRPKAATGTLFVVATPIGNLEDITLRAIKTLHNVDLIAAEDTRHTQRLLRAHGIESRLISYHEHNEQQRARQLMDRLNQGASIALVSDAGTPTVSDPGYRLVQAAAAHQIPVVPIPGVSAAIAALSASGLATDSFTFIGFPARKKAKRHLQLKELANSPHTLIFYQSPRRVVPLLEELCAAMGDRAAVVARELTKLHEEFIHGTLSEIAAELKQRPAVKGECTVLVGAAQPPPSSDADLEAAVRATLQATERSSMSDIAKTLAKQFKVSRKAVYDTALRIRKGEEQ
ncbi:MAG: 16S rRNA (cytidine(1402)-2'-O)-methyltransferase [Desulfobacteraceae bacterium]|jgi:16S rRNA (cytidine1402-2'-O)-methyltransferase